MKANQSSGGLSESFESLGGAGGVVQSAESSGGQTEVSPKIYQFSSNSSIVKESYTQVFKALLMPSQ